MQVELLGLLLLQSDRSWTLAELSRTLRAPSSSVHRELRRAVGAGIVTEATAQRPHRYRAAKELPAYRPLRDLLSLTVGVEDRLRQALLEESGVKAAAIHGSWARGSIRPDSDIDLIVITEGDRASVQRVARSTGRSIGREVDVSVLTVEAYRELAGATNPFLELILTGPRIDLVGDIKNLKSADG